MQIQRDECLKAKKNQKKNRYIQQNMGVKVSSLPENTLKQIATTTLNSKYCGADSEFFSKLVVDAVQSVRMRNAKGEWKYPVNQINIVRSHGKSTSESALIKNGERRLEFSGCIAGR
jgi:T-complex protein 1 subunit alpha